MSILVVDDNDKNLRFLNDVLELQGFEVATAASGAEAVAQTRRLKPQLILMDVQMPEMSGTEAMKTLRAHPETASIPIVAVTALAMKGDEKRLLEAGFDAYISKPVALKGLLALVRTLLDGKA